MLLLKRFSLLEHQQLITCLINQLYARSLWKFATTIVLNPDKEVILYAPTFRKDKRVDMQSLLSKFDTSNNIVVVKAHPLDAIKADSTDIIFDNVFSTTDNV